MPTITRLFKKPKISEDHPDSVSDEDVDHEPPQLEGTESTKWNFVLSDMKMMNLPQTIAMFCLSFKNSKFLLMQGSYQMVQ